MALHPDRLSFVAATLGFLLILASTVPAACKVICRLARKQQPIQLSTESGTAPFAPQDSLQAYEDEDGVATKASLQAFSDGWQKAAIMILSVVGFHLALALAVVAPAPWSGPDIRSAPFWLQAGAWVGVARPKMKYGN